MKTRLLTDRCLNTGMLSEIYKARRWQVANLASF